MLQLYIKMLAPLLARQTGPGRACSPSEGGAAGERAEETHRISKKARARPRRNGCAHSTACTRGRHNYRTQKDGRSRSRTDSTTTTHAAFSHARGGTAADALAQQHLEPPTGSTAILDMMGFRIGFAFAVASNCGR